jgi:hypothetical protein
MGGTGGTEECYRGFSKDCAIGGMDLQGSGGHVLGEVPNQGWHPPEGLLTRRAGRGPADPRK